MIMAFNFADHMAKPNRFNPTELSTDHWIEAAKSFGAKYAVVTLDHFSGFLLWPSNTYNYTVKQTKWKRGKGDIAAEFIQSCKRNGLEYGFYYSAHKNWFMGVDNYTAQSFKGQKRYNDVVREHMREHFGNQSRYGKPFYVWFDAGIVPGKSPNIGPMVRSLASTAICSQCPSFAGNHGLQWVGTREQRRRCPTGTRSQQRHVSCAHYFDAGCLYIFMSQLISREALYKKK